jgi:hypothetical protein
LNDYEMPIFHSEEATGVPTLATDFFNKLGTADLLVISLQNITALIRRHSKIFLTDFENSRYDIPRKTNLNNGYFTGPRGGSSV